MKKFGFLVLSLSISAMALALGGAAPRLATPQELELANLLINRQVMESREIRAFNQLASYIESVSLEQKAKSKKIRLEGLFTVGGDMACGNIGLEITETYISNPGDPLFPGRYQYTPRLVRSGFISDYCQEYMNEVLKGLKVYKVKDLGKPIAGMRSIVQHMLKAKIYEDKNLNDFIENTYSIHELKFSENNRKISLQMKSTEVHGDVLYGDVYYELYGKSYTAQGFMGPQEFWKYQSKFRRIIPE